MCVSGKQEWRALRWRAEDFWKSKSLQIQRRWLNQLDVYGLPHICESLWFPMWFSWRKLFNISVYTMYLPLGDFLISTDVYVCVSRLSHHPFTPCFWSSEMPKDREPIKSFRLVKSQSQISTDSLRSLSDSFRLLSDTERRREEDRDDERRRQRNQAEHLILHFPDKQITDLLAVPLSFLTMWRSRSMWDSGSTWWSWSSVCSHSWGQGWVLAWHRGQRGHSGPWAPGSSLL